jgi:glycosyltransferase 2 family protein
VAFRKKDFLYFLPKLLGLGILVWILYKVGYKEPLKLAKLLGFPFIFLILILNIPHILFKSLRWKIILKNNGVNYPFFKSVKAYFSGIAIGIITPGRAGEFFRALYPVKEGYSNYPVSIASVISDRIYDLTLLLFLSFVTSLIIFSIIYPIIIFTVIVLLTLIILKFRGFIFKFIEKRLNKWGIKPENLVQFKKSFNNSFHPPVWQILFTICSYFIMNLQIYIMASKMGIPIGFIKLLLLFSLANTLALLPVSIMGLGTREAALGFLFTIIGLKGVQGVTISLGFFILVSIPVILCGSFFLFFSSNNEEQQDDLDHKNNP